MKVLNENSQIRKVHYIQDRSEYEISYTLTRKQVKNINLRIKENKEIAVSAHPKVPVSYIDDFVLSKAPFILEAVNHIEQKKQEMAEVPHEFVTGERFRILGKDYKLCIEEVKNEESVFLRDEELVLKTKWPEHYPHKKNLVEKWFRLFAHKLFGEIIDRVYPLFVPYGAPYPVWTIRSMTSRWGSCQPGEGKITLNLKLIAYPEEAIEYVVVHEFAHFVHADHSGAFWSLVAKIMPDYRERKNILK